MKISVLSLFRDSEKTIDRTLSQLSSLEKNTDANFSFYFYENDSIDNTLQILLNWAASRNARVVSEKLNYPRFGSVSSTQRFELMSYYRNKLFDTVRPIESDYTLLLDSDVIIYDNLINDYMKYFTNNVVMCTPNTVVNTIECKMGLSGPVYYDSLALIDSYGYPGMTWSSCPFYKKEDRDNWISGKPIKVKSAFAGAALIKTKILNEVNWTLYDPVCEHWAFCGKINRYGDIISIPSIVCNVESCIDDIPQSHIDAVISSQRRNYDFINSKH